MPKEDDSNGHGPASAGVVHINQYGEQHFKGVLECCWTGHKGRVCLAKRDFEQGEIILSESPLHVVQEDEACGAWNQLVKLCKDHENDFDYEPLWYWCALRSLTIEQLKGAKAVGPGVSEDTQRNLLLLHHEPVDEPGKTAEILSRELAPGSDPVVLANLIQVWVLNCFEYSDTPRGYSTYFFSSFMSHSCFPNAIWHYSGDEHVLRARRPIRVGDEVCISYLTEDFLLQSAPERRWDLSQTKHFWCACERCAPPALDFSRGHPCPKCKSGTVFAHVPTAGPAKDASLLPSQLTGARCNQCSHIVAKKEVDKMSYTERRLKKIVDDFTTRNEEETEPITAEEAKEAEELIDISCSQHVLADLMWEQLASYHLANNRRAEQRRFLRRRCDFLQAAYPGLSPAYAWALEALGDTLTVTGPGAKVDRETAKELYAESLSVLRPMFGDDHEYVTGLCDKHASVA